MTAERLRLSAAAASLGIHRHTLLRWIRDGRIPEADARKSPGGYWSVDAEWVRRQGKIVDNRAE
jgi:excisionase family DNA binding protein